MSRLTICHVCKNVDKVPGYKICLMMIDRKQNSISKNQQIRGVTVDSCRKCLKLAVNDAVIEKIHSPSKRRSVSM